MTNPVRIGIDGFNLAMARGTGIATYARVLSHALCDMGHPVEVLYGLMVSPTASPAMREVLFYDRLDAAPRKAPAFASKRWLRERTLEWRRVSAVEIPIAGLVDGRAFRLPHFDRLLNSFDVFGLASRYFRRTGQFLRLHVPEPPAIMHWTYPLPIVVEGARNIYTVHDVVPLRLPHTTLDDKEFFLRLLTACVAEAAQIVTVSEASRADILRWLPQAAGRVTNTYESVEPADPCIGHGEALAPFLQGVFGLEPRGYFLFLGSLEPKKNIGRLLEAYLSSGVSTPLVIVGAQAWKSERELSLLSLGNPRVRQIDYLPFASLQRLIAGARAVLFPSLSEGFGLPVLEAMALGTPVLTSTEGSLPEIAGDAALLVDPYDVGAICRGIQSLDSDAALRARLSAAGRPQAARFGPEPYRARLAALYASVLT